MVAPKRPIRRVESSSNYYMVLFVKILFVLVILFMLPSMVDGGRRKREKRNRRANTVSGIVHRKRQSCEADCMEHIIYAEEAMNCIQECVSSTCFQEIYETPLEPGEIDLDKANRLQNCAKQEVVETRKNERQKRKEEQEKK